MEHFPRISFVIPTLNEALNLPYVLPAVAAVADEVVVVDGFSTDDTINVALQIIPQARVVRQTRRGKGNALQVGFAACTGDIIVMIDADGSTDATEVPRFVEMLLRGADFVKGSRFVAGGGSEDITPLRRLGNRWLMAFVNLLFSVKFSDLCYGYNAFWRDCLDVVQIDSDGFEVETLMSLRAVKANLKIAEVPSTEHKRIHGFTNLKTFRDGWRVLRTIIRERFNGGVGVNAVRRSERMRLRQERRIPPISRWRVDMYARFRHLDPGRWLDEVGDAASPRRGEVEEEMETLADLARHPVSTHISVDQRGPADEAMGRNSAQAGNFLHQRQ